MSMGVNMSMNMYEYEYGNEYESEFQYGYEYGYGSGSVWVGGKCKWNCEYEFLKAYLAQFEPDDSLRRAVWVD